MFRKPLFVASAFRGYGVCHNGLECTLLVSPDKVHVCCAFGRESAGTLRALIGYNSLPYSAAECAPWFFCQRPLRAEARPARLFTDPYAADEGMFYLCCSRWRIVWVEFGRGNTDAVLFRAKNENIEACKGADNVCMCFFS